jgi:peptide/nickel transport system permease protein
MTAFLIRRLLESALVMVVVAIIAFALFRFVGDPIGGMVSQDATIEQRNALRAELHLDDPILVQGARFIWNALHLDFGVSYKYRQPVVDLIGGRLPATLELSVVASLIAVGFGIPLGVFAGINRDSPATRLIMAVSLVGVSLPTFLIGILLIYLFSVTLHWLPSYGRGETVSFFGLWQTGLLTASGLRALILPAITLGLFQLTLVMRLVRSEMLEVLRTEYIRFGRARGLTQRAIHFAHALKNTLVPVVTIIGLQLGSIIAFSIITETVFQWPGMGLLFISAVQFADIPIMSAYLLLTSAIFVTINLVVDIIYVLIDPRIRLTARS